MSIFKLDSPLFRVINRIIDLVVLGILTALFCVPVITAGASIASMYYVTLKMARNEEGNMIRQFFAAFKQNFWKATALWFIEAFVVAVFVIDFILLNSLDFDYEDTQRLLLLVLGGILTLIGSYILPMQAQFENGVFRTIKNAFLISVMNIPWSLLILVIKIVPFVVFYFFPEALVLIVAVSLGGIPYLESEVLNHVFSKYIPDEEPPARSSLPESVLAESRTGEVTPLSFTDTEDVYADLEEADAAPEETDIAEENTENGNEEK